MIAISVQVNLKRENHTLRPEEEREGRRGAFYRATFLLQCTGKYTSTDIIVHREAKCFTLAAPLTHCTKLGNINIVGHFITDRSTLSFAYLSFANIITTR